MVDIRPLIALGIVAFLSGCAGSLPARTIDEGASLDFAQGEAAIFGRFLFTADGQDGGAGSSSGTPSSFDIWAADKNQRSRLPFRAVDGRFLVVLPVGNYELDAIFPGFLVGGIQPAMEFHIREQGTIYYIGTIRIDVTTWSFLWVRQIGDIENIAILDELDIERDRLKIQMPDMQSMRFDSAETNSIPGRSARIVSEESGVDGALFLPILLVPF